MDRLQDVGIFILVLEGFLVDKIAKFGIFKYKYVNQGGELCFK